jgi:hypothetical protein
MSSSFLLGKLHIALGKVIVIGTNPNHGTFGNTMVFFKSLNTRELLFLDSGVVILGVVELAPEESNRKAGLLIAGA